MLKTKENYFGKGTGVRVLCIKLVWFSKIGEPFIVQCLSGLWNLQLNLEKPSNLIHKCAREMKDINRPDDSCWQWIKAPEFYILILTIMSNEQTIV